MRNKNLSFVLTSGFTLMLGLACVAPAMAQNAKPVPSGEKSAPGQTPAPLPPGYIIGPSDVLSIVFWRDKDMSTDVTVRPDGKISLPLLNDVDAAGQTPEELRTKLLKASSKFLEDPDVTVQVREIRSRNVYIMGGGVVKPSTLPLNTDMTVMQLIAAAGGLQEYANKKDIVVLRNEGGRQQTFKFNYKEVVNLKNLAQNILLRPGDIVVVN
jgi:polysaccharide export outer membrane protein